MKILRLDFCSRTAVFIGSGEGGNITDAFIRRDAAGNPVIPGTAIAGTLRSLLTRLAPRLRLENRKPCVALFADAELTKNQKKMPCQCPVCHLMGDILPLEEEDATSEVRARAEGSRLLVFNGIFKNENKHTYIRDGVGIDRSTGAAARSAHVKFDLETLPTGATFKARMELRHPTPDDQRLLAAGLAEWRAGRAWLGGRTARGLGAFSVDVTCVEVCIKEDDDLVRYLKADDLWNIAKPNEAWLTDQIEAIGPVVSISETPEKIRHHLACTWIEIRGTMKAKDAVLTNDTSAATLIGFDHAPLLAGLKGRSDPILSGASLRGVLRSQAEKIARTLATLDTEDFETFRVTCPACNPVESRKEAPLANCDSLLPPDEELVEAGEEYLCLACRLFGSTRRGSRLRVEDASYDREAAGREPTYKVFDFLAIDRFTGGGADHLKFDALTLWKPAFRLKIFCQNPEPWELGWLALALRDLGEGRLPVGMGAAKGFGKMMIEDFKLTFGYLAASDLAPFNLEANGKRQDSVYTQMTLGLDDMLSWVSDFNTELKAFRRGEEEHGQQILPPIPADTYFTTIHGLAVPELYPKKVKL